MTELIENGPKRPTTEAEKIGESLYRALVKYYGDYKLSSTYIANGKPKVVSMRFKVSHHDSDHEEALDTFQEDAQTLLEDYEFDHNQFSIMFETNGDEHIIRIQALTE